MAAGPAPRTISFDLDGAIWRNPFNTGISPRLRAHLRTSSALADVSDDEADRRVQAAFEEVWGKRLAAGSWVEVYDLDGVYAEVASALGLEPAFDVAALYREACAEDGIVGLLPGSRSGLQRLHDAGFRLVAISNGYHAYQRPVMESVGIDHLFEAVITPEAAGFAKPDPRVFTSVPGLVAHAGDLVVADVMGANLAGLTSVWLDRALPESLRGLSPTERTRASSFDAHLEAAVAVTPFLEFYTDATVETCRPDIVAVDVDEAATALLERFG